MTAHCACTETHFLPRPARPRGTDHPVGRPRSEPGPALLTSRDKIRRCTHSLARFPWPSRCVCCSCRGGRRKTAGMGTMLSPGSQEEGTDPGHQLKTAASSLISKSCILNAFTSEMWKTGAISFQSQLVEKEVTIDFWHDPKDTEFKRWE